jgi:hypothetical protein
VNRALPPLLLLALAVLAGVPARADAPAPAPDLGPEDFALLPLSEIQRDYLLRDHPALAMRATLLAKRAERVRAHRGDRDDPDDDAGRRLAEELHGLREQGRSVVAELREVLPRYGVPDDVFERVARAPEGPLREERYAHALVLDAPGLDPACAALLRRIVPAADGALLALHAERRRAERAAKGQKDHPEAPVAQAATAAAVGIEKRFWRAVDVLADSASRRWVRLRLPARLSEYADGLGHLYRLPDLTPSQGVRLKALLVELDAEAQADGAEVRRVDARLAEGGVPDAERRDLERAKRDAVRRATEAKIRAYEAAKAVLTPAQMDEYRAIPPHVTTAERAQNPRDLTKTMDLSPAQVGALADLAKAYESEKRRIEGEVLRVQMAAGDMGPDSPRQDETMMAYAGIQARAATVIAEATREVFLSLLTPEQVVAWVLGWER